MDIRTFAAKIKREYYSTSNSRFTNLENIVEQFFQSCSLRKARETTIKFIIATDDQLANFSINEKYDKDFYFAIFETICLNYGKFIKENCNTSNDEEYVICAKIPDQRWERCFKILIYLNMEKCGQAVDKLLNIRYPDTEYRAYVIEVCVTDLINSQDENCFLRGVDYVTNFDIRKIKNLEFDNIVYRCYIYGYEGKLGNLLTTEKNKKRYLQLLKDTFKRVMKEKPYLNDYEEIFCKKISKLDLSDIINDESIKYRLNEE